MTSTTYHITAAAVEHTAGRVRSAHPTPNGLLESIPGVARTAAIHARRHAQSGQAVLLTGPGDFRPRLYRPGARARGCGWAYEVQTGCGHWRIPDTHGNPVPLCADCATAVSRRARAAAQEAAVRAALASGQDPTEVLVPLGFAAGLLGLRPETLRGQVKRGAYPGAVRTDRADGKGFEWRIPLAEISFEKGVDVS